VKRFVLPLLILCLVALVAPAAANAMTYDQAVDRLVADGYPLQVETFLTSLGTSPLGFRIAGTSAEHAASAYVADQLRDIRLSNVHLEAVPVDAWDFRGASVTVGDRILTASSFAGVPGTVGPITAPLVYVGQGTADEFDAAGDVTGKLVLVDGEFDDWWVNFVGGEATLRGAAGIVMTHGVWTSPWYDKPNALGGNDGEYDDGYVPMVYVAWEDGDWLKAQLKAGPVEATMQADIQMTLAEAGGHGYNVMGTLVGKNPDLAPVLFSSHVDAHFRAGLDDTGAVANELLLAKALKLSGKQPQRTVIFLFTCAEEYGYTDCWYDWSIGAWYAITHEHPEWAGKLAMMINLELMAKAGLPLEVRGAAETVQWADDVATKEFTPYGFLSTDLPDTWNDQWSFNASGVPTLTVDTWNKGYDLIYHTNLETKELMDYAYLGTVAKYDFRLLQGLDSGVLPYDLSKRADQVAFAFPGSKLAEAGVSKKAIAGVQAAASSFSKAAYAWDARRMATPEADVAAVNEQLVAIEKTINRTFTGRTAWDWTAYPQEQPMIDAIHLDNAIKAAEAGNVPRAQRQITWFVGTNWYLEVFSPEVVRQDMTRHYADYEHIAWGAMGSPPLTFDCIDEWLQLGNGQVAQAIEGLKPERARAQNDLRMRIAGMTAVLKDLTTRVNAL